MLLLVRDRFAALLAIQLLLTLGAASGRALPILDQSSWPPTAEVWIDNDAGIAQTFTVGVTGQLVRLDLWVVRGPGEEGASLVLSSASFGTVSVSALSGSTVPGLVAVDLTSLALQVTAGDVVEFDVEHDNVVVLGATEDVYRAGELLWSCALDGCIHPAGPTEPFVEPGPPDFVVTLDLAPLDIAFRSYIPEPTAGALLGLGLAGVLRRRRLAARRTAGPTPASS